MKSKLTIGVILLQAAIGVLVVFTGVKLAYTVVGDAASNDPQAELSDRYKKALEKSAAKKASSEDAFEGRKTDPDFSLLGEIKEENPLLGEDFDEDEDDEETKTLEELLSDGECPITTMPYELVGAMISDDPRISMAAMRIAGGIDVRLMKVGSETYDEEEKVLVAAIGYDPEGKERIVFSREGRYECMDYDYRAKGGSEPRGPMPIRKIEKEEKPSDNKYLSRIRKEGNQTVVDQNLITEAMTNMADTLRQAKMRPEKRGGKMVGFRFQRIQKGSMLEALGFLQGDVITKINGMPLDSPDKALEVYGRLRSSQNFSVEVLRGGKPQALDFNLR